MSSFDFENYNWPPKGPITDDRFVVSNEIIAQGGFRDVYEAEDSVTDQPLVIKKFRDCNPKNAKFWKKDIKASAVAQYYADRFSFFVRCSKYIEFIQPIIDTADPVCDWRKYGIKDNEKFLVEPNLGVDDYEKFNSNFGW